MRATLPQPASPKTTLMTWLHAECTPPRLMMHDLLLSLGAYLPCPAHSTADCSMWV